MRTVKINTKELLEILKTNREQHIKDYNEARTGYRADAIAELTKMLEQAIDDGTILRFITAVEPVSYEASYNTVVRMLELSADTLTELTMQEFTQYVEDKWGWKESFTNTTAFYANKK